MASVSSAMARLSTPELTDGLLAHQTLEGDETSFERLVQRYSPHLFNYIIHILGNYDQACDVLQQVFLQLYISLATLNQQGSFKGWLYHVAHNRCIDELRHKRATYFSEISINGENDDCESVLTMLIDPTPQPEVLVEHREVQRMVGKAIRELPIRLRAVVALRYTKQLTFSEIGARLHMPEATAKTYFQRAKPLLRQAFQNAECPVLPCAAN
jgi:RNA polymerase sigma-70 factor (ECF subfamily)